MNDAEIVQLEWLATAIILIPSLWLMFSGVAALRNIYSMVRYGKPINEDNSYIV